jgi:tensin
MAPPLERLCSIVYTMDSWMEADPENVVVVHCKGGKGRTGVVIAAYLSFKRLFTRAEDAMQQFALKRFSGAGDDEEVGITNPSQRRYVLYFTDLVTGSLRVRRTASDDSFLALAAIVCLTNGCPFTLLLLPPRRCTTVAS